jgi:hypothetical protein
MLYFAGAPLEVSAHNFVSRFTWTRISTFSFTRSTTIVIVSHVA